MSQTSLDAPGPSWRSRSYLNIWPKQHYPSNSWTKAGSPLIFTWAKHLGMHQNPIEGQGHILTFDLHFGGQRSLIKDVTTLTHEW